MFCIAFALALPVKADASDNTTTLTINIPDSHTVTLDIKEHGAVLVNGKSYTGKTTVQIARLKEQGYEIKPDKGWQIDTVRYGMSDSMETVTVNDMVFTAPAIHEDGYVLTVTFKKAPVVPTTKKPTNSKTGNVTTGDTGNLFFWELLLGVSGMTVLGMKRKRRNGKG